MRALLAYATKTLPVLEETVPPAMGPVDVRVRVAAAAINPVDLGVVGGRVREAVEFGARCPG